MRTLGAFLLAFAVAGPASAQAVSFRPFFVVTGEQLAAKSSFDAVLGGSFQPFLGGGVSVVLAHGVWVDLAISRFEKTGQRAFDNNGQIFQLGIPLTIAITPIEVSGGYRFRTRPRLWTYLGAGVGSYGYDESSSDAIAADNVSTRHTGFLLVGGVEGRIQKWISLSGDVQYTHVTGILGTAGISKDLGENDLGGIGIRFRVLVGK
jgi:opacity protein-like surface antigen